MPTRKQQRKKQKQPLCRNRVSGGRRYGEAGAFIRRTPTQWLEQWKN
jgi:hypothetical protein